MEILRWEVFAPLIAVVGICEAFQGSKVKALTKMPTSVLSLVLSAGFGFLVTYVIPGDPSWQKSALYGLLIFGASTLAYEMVLKRFEYIRKRHCSPETVMSENKRENND